MSSIIYSDSEGISITVPYKDEIRGGYSISAPVDWSKTNFLDILSIFSFNPVPKKVIFSGPATIVIWRDGSKTVVKCMDGDAYDKEKGFAMAYLKKIFGKSVLKKLIKEFVDDND